MTDLQTIMGKELSMETMQDMVLKLKVLNESEVQLHFEETDEDNNVRKSLPAIEKLEIMYDDIEGITDYSFNLNGISRYFLFQFE